MCGCASLAGECAGGCYSAKMVVVTGTTRAGDSENRGWKYEEMRSDCKTPVG